MTFPVDRVKEAVGDYGTVDQLEHEPYCDGYACPWCENNLEGPFFQALVAEEYDLKEVGVADFTQEADAWQWLLLVRLQDKSMTGARMQDMARLGLMHNAIGVELRYYPFTLHMEAYNEHGKQRIVTKPDEFDLCVAKLWCKVKNIPYPEEE